MTFLLSLLVASGTLSRWESVPTKAWCAPIPAVNDLDGATPLAWDDDPSRPSPQPSLDYELAEPVTEQLEDDEELSGLLIGSCSEHVVWPQVVRCHPHARHLCLRLLAQGVCLRC